MAALTDLAAIYHDLARPWTPDELAAAYRAANERGESDLHAGQTPSRALPLLATAVPRLTSLAVATYAVHVLPGSNAPERADLDDELLSILDITSAGSLRRCHLALELDGRAAQHTIQESLPVVCDLAAEALHRASLAVEPPSVVEHAQQAGRWVAIAIEALDQGAPTASEALVDSLGHLLVVCVFADAARGRHMVATRE